MSVPGGWADSAASAQQSRTQRRTGRSVDARAAGGAQDGVRGLTGRPLQGSTDGTF